MNEDSSTANGDESVENPNELGTEMTEAEEQAFVNKTLGIEDQDASEDKGEEDKQTDESTADKEKSGDSPDSPDKPEDEEGDEPEGDQSPDAAEPDKPEDTEETDETESTSELAGPQTDDLWVEVERQITDKEGNKTTESVKLVYDPANPAAFLPDDFQFTNDKQLFEILDAKAEIAALYKNRVDAFEAKSEEQQAKDSKAQADKDVQAGWDSEIQNLIDAGIIEAPKLKPADKGFLEDPAVQKLDQVFKYMKAQNEERSKEGKPLLRSFGTALNLMTKADEAKAEEDKKKNDNKVAKQRGSLVGGTSASSSSDGPSYVRGSASNIWGVKVD